MLAGASGCRGRCPCLCLEGLQPSAVSGQPSAHSRQYEVASRQPPADPPSPLCLLSSASCLPSSVSSRPRDSPPWRDRPRLRALRASVVSCGMSPGNAPDGGKAGFAHDFLAPPTGRGRGPVWPTPGECEARQKPTLTDRLRRRWPSGTAALQQETKAESARFRAGTRRFSAVRPRRRGYPKSPYMGGEGDRRQETEDRRQETNEVQNAGSRRPIPDARCPTSASVSCILSPSR